MSQISYIHVQLQCYIVILKLGMNVMWISVSQHIHTSNYKVNTGPVAAILDWYSHVLISVCTNIQNVGSMLPQDN